MRAESSRDGRLKDTQVRKTFPDRQEPLIAASHGVVDSKPQMRRLPELEYEVYQVAERSWGSEEGGQVQDSAFRGQARQSGLENGYHRPRHGVSVTQKDEVAARMQSGN